MTASDVGIFGCSIRNRESYEYRDGGIGIGNTLLVGPHTWDMAPQ